MDELRVSDHHTQLQERERERERETYSLSDRQKVCIEEVRLTSTLVPSPLGSLEAASRTAHNDNRDGNSVHLVLSNREMCTGYRLTE